MTKQNFKLTLKDKTELDDKVIELFKTERLKAKERFPLTHALIATFGALCVFAGINKLIENIEFLNNNPITLVLVGLFILGLTGAAYKKLG